MAPLRGNIKKRKVEEMPKSLITATPGDGFGEWWKILSKKKAGEASTSRRIETFQSTFGMSRKTFDYICSIVKYHMMARTYTFTDGSTLSLQDQVALALRTLVSGNSLDVIGKMFKTHQSTVNLVTWNFVEAIEKKRLLHLRWPSIEELDEVKSKFQNISGLPNCCGAIDTTHILMRMKSSDKDTDRWVDNRENYSMILQVIVDAEMRIINVVTGWPGWMNESLVLKNSSFFREYHNGQRLNVRTSGETGVQEYLIGDEAFPLLPWLMTPYQGSELSRTKMDFNIKLAAIHSVAKKALGRLKEMWRMLEGDLWRPEPNKICKIILACCILHNIVIDKEKDEGVEQFTPTVMHDPGYQQEICEDDDNTGSFNRDMLAEPQNMLL